jgi:hypothetical protein
MNTVMRHSAPGARQSMRHARRHAGIRLAAAVGLWLSLLLTCAAQVPDRADDLATPGDLRASYWSVPQFTLGNPNNDPLFGEGTPGQLFGYAMALDGDTLAVGAWNGGDDQGQPTGAVYIFGRVAGEWVRQAKLLAPDADIYDAFGAEVALQGDTLVVGAPNYSRAPFDYQGAAYVFVRDAQGWHYQQKLLETTQQSDGHFGSAIALNQNTLAISSGNRWYGNLYGAGAVYLFGRSAGQWQPQQEITAPVPTQHGNFGSSLLLLDEELFVGASGETFQAGAAYVFARENSTWTPHQRLVPQVSNELDLFGTQIAGHANRVLISSPAHLGSGSETGKVIEWQRIAGQWVQGQTQIGDMVPDLKRFGRRLDYRNGRWLVSSELTISTPPAMVGVELWTYEEIGGALIRTMQISLPYTGDRSYGLRSLVSSADQILVGLPGSFAFPYASAGEVRIYNAIPPAPGAQLTLNTGGTATGENFGAAIATNSDWLLVGTPYERRQSATAGAVFAYPRELALQVPPTALYANDATARDRFGSALAWSNDTLLVGAPGNAGAVYHFTPLGFNWMQIDKWPAPPSPNRSLFGNAIAASADRAVVSAEQELIPNSNGYGSGVAYVYERNAGGWQTPQRLQVSDATTESGIGKSVAIDQDTIVLGAVPFIIEGPFGAPALGEGAAYVFTRTAQGWIEQAKLVRPLSSEIPAAFGMAVAVSGDTLFVGAPRVQQVHVFQRQGGVWSWVEVLSAPPGITEGFGAKVSIVDGQLWVSTDTDIAGSSHIGSLHLYQLRDGHWQQQQSFAPVGANSYSAYATSFAAIDNMLYVGAPGISGYVPSIYQSGSVFVHELPLFADGFEN